MARVGGIIRLTVDGAQLQAKGAFTANEGNPKKEMVVGTDGIHGHKETIQVPYIDGAITDSLNLDTTSLCNITGATVIVDFANGKSFVLRDAVFAAEGEVSSEEGEIKVRFEGTSGKWVK